MTAVLEATGIVVTRHGRGAPLLDGVELRVGAGELVALVGPNGAGKSTLLHVLAGDVTPDRGEVRLGGTPLRSLGAGPAARLRSVLTQDNEVLFAFRVADIVEMGRAPWLGRAEAAEDDAAVAAAMAATEVRHLADRRVPALSGGERARTALARVLAQRCGLVLLDEPTASLDVRHQERTLAGLRAHTAAGGAVVVVLHDLDLAAAYVDRIVLLDAGRVHVDAPPALALDPALLEDVYRHPFDVEHTADGVRVRPARSPAAPSPTIPSPPEETRAHV